MRLRLRLRLRKNRRAKSEKSSELGVRSLEKKTKDKY